MRGSPQTSPLGYHTFLIILVSLIHVLFPAFKKAYLHVVGTYEKAFSSSSSSRSSILSITATIRQELASTVSCLPVLSRYQGHYKRINSDSRYVVPIGIRK